MIRVTTPGERYYWTAVDRGENIIPPMPCRKCGLVWEHDPQCPTVKKNSREGSTMAATTCTRAPEGWRCTRKAPHDGPCAAVLIVPTRHLAAARVALGKMSMDEFLLNVVDARGLPLFGGDSTMILQHISAVAEQLDEYLKANAAQESLKVPTPDRIQTLADYKYVREQIGEVLSGNEFRGGIEPGDLIMAERLIAANLMDEKKILGWRK